VTWPGPLRSRLVGTAHVRLHNHDGDRIHFDGPVSFAGNPDALMLVDPSGHPLSVDKAGHLTRVFGETGAEARRHVVEGTARALADLRDRVGVDAHLTYGALLGAVREGRMIAHDSDADLAYLSCHQHPADVVLESYRIERGMRSLGWKVVRMSGADLKLLLPLPDGRTVHVDVFGAFHVGETFYQLGGRSGLLDRDALTPASSVVLEGVELAAPGDPERVLEFLYGPDWRVPDPAFQSEDPEPGVARLDGWLRGFRTHVPEWNELFRNHRAQLPRGASSYATWVRARLPTDTVVVDLGAGNGRDSVYFAGQGHRVIACDFAGASLRQTRRRLDGIGAQPDVRVLVLGDLRTVLLAGAELAREPEPPHLYARQLLGCLDGPGRANLWRLAGMALRRGGALHLELTAATRQDVDEGGLAAGLVSRLDPVVVIAEIEASGGRVVHAETGPGHDFLDRPDPAVTRIEARWDPPRGESMTRTTSPRRSPLRAIDDVRARLRERRAAVQENRRLNRRIAELTDLVTELVVPIADRDEEKVRELLAEYRSSTLAP